MAGIDLTVVFLEIYPEACLAQTHLRQTGDEDVAAEARIPMSAGALEFTWR
jgi:hypothetical protein